MITRDNKVLEHSTPHLPSSVMQIGLAKRWVFLSASRSQSCVSPQELLVQIWSHVVEDGCAYDFVAILPTRFPPGRTLVPLSG